MALLRTIFWVALFVFFTFCFVVFFEYGTHDFVDGFKKEYARVEKFVKEAAQKPAAKDKEKKP